MDNVEASRPYMCKEHLAGRGYAGIYNGELFYKCFASQGYEDGGHQGFHV